VWVGGWVCVGGGALPLHAPAERPPLSYDLAGCGQLAIPSSHAREFLSILSAAYPLPTGWLLGAVGSTWEEAEKAAKDYWGATKSKTKQTWDQVGGAVGRCPVFLLCSGVVLAAVGDGGGWPGGSGRQRMSCVVCGDCVPCTKARLCRGRGSIPGLGACSLLAAGASSFLHASTCMPFELHGMR
jgi:hypothetical protein